MVRPFFNVCFTSKVSFSCLLVQPNIVASFKPQPTCTGFGAVPVNTPIRYSTIASMYLLVYPALNSTQRAKGSPTTPQPSPTRLDFVTPDGLIVPRAAGEAALLGHTAVLVGGLFVGIWSQL